MNGEDRPAPYRLVVTVREVAEVAEVVSPSKALTWTLIAGGGLPDVRIGRAVRVRRTVHAIHDQVPCLLR